MHPDMLILAERLVKAMESVSQDVKNMSAYVYDISCSVSYLLHERREKENISPVAYDDGDDPSSATSGLYEEAAERPSSYMEPENEDNSFVDLATTSIDPHENSDGLSSERNLVFTGEIKTEGHFELEVNNGSHDLDNMYGDSGHHVKLSREVKCEPQFETDREGRAYGLRTTISHSMGQLTSCESITRMESASNPEPQEIQCVETPNNSAINNDHSAFGFRLPEGQTSVAGTSQMESAENFSMPYGRVHPEERSYKCSVCEKSFKAHHHLQNHIRVHTGEKPCKCNYCGKAFAQSGTLSHHLRSHTGVRRYRCNVCGKAFSTNTCLTLHMRIHTGEKPYQCTICGRAFSQNVSLRYHMGTHTGEKPYRCTLCAMSFVRRSALKQHMHTHS